jgi:hypothetical protein
MAAIQLLAQLPQQAAAAVVLMSRATDHLEAQAVALVEIMVQKLVQLERQIKGTKAVTLTALKVQAVVVRAR